MIIYVVLAVLLVLVAIRSFFRYATRTGKLLHKIPGPPSLPLSGNILDLLTMIVKGWDFVKFLHETYYPTFKLWIFMEYVVFIFHPDDLKILLSHRKNVNKCPRIYDEMRIQGTDGIFLSTDNKWKNRRKMISPTFKMSVLKNYARKADKHVERFMENFRSRGEEFVLDVSEKFQELSFEIISDAAMGIDVRDFRQNLAKEYIQNAEEMIEASFYFGFRSYIPSWIRNYMSEGRKRIKAIKVMNAIAKEMIDERRKYHERDGFQSLMDNDSNDIEEKDSHNIAPFMDKLLAAEMKGLIDEQGIIEEINIMFNGGYDTASVAIGFALALLAENKEAQDLARNEVIKVMNENGGEIRMEDYSKYFYLECCMKETLRLFPSAPVIGRNIKEEVQLKNYTLPVNTQVLMPILFIQRNPNFWPNPNEFDPARFLPENSKDRHPFAYIPFSSGPRNCIGQKFGSMELLAVVAHMLYHFHLEPIDSTRNLKLRMNHITLRTDDPIRVKFIRINHNKII